MRQDVSFMSRGQRLAAWLFLPRGPAPAGGFPAVALAHGLSCVKEQGLEPVAERFAAAGLAALAFDFRHLGASGGEPRGQVFPLEQAEDYSSALSWLAARPGLDPQRLGAWGTSLSGGVALHLAVFDRRVRAVAVQVPSLLNCENCRFLDPGPEGPLTRFLQEDRAARHATGAVNSLPVVAPEGEPCVLAGPEAREAFAALGAQAPSWKNAVTVESLERLREFDAARHIGRIAPTPLLLIGAEQDELIPAGLTREAFARAGEPKALVLLPCRHFDLYAEPWRGQAAEAAARWFAERL